MTARAATWLLLVTNLPGRNPRLRMRIWRGLKSAGAGSLRDGVYLLPNSESARRVFDQQTAEIKGAGGVAYILCLQAESSAQHSALVGLFDRAAEYAEAMRRLDVLKRELTRLPEAIARQRLSALAREVTTIEARDFFPAQPRRQVEGALADAEAALNARFAPDEPRPAHRTLRPRGRKDYIGRTWATREHLWIDRVASAWLIRRFIDPGAKFLWLKRAKDCPKRVVGFDFDGAEFTHVASRVTFEVLVASFGLGEDAALARLGALVHELDVGGIPVAEASGLATIMAGARMLQADDDALLKAMTPVLDHLYAGYGIAVRDKAVGIPAPRSER